MADIETLTLFRADTGEAVKSIGDLKESIKNLKKELEGMKIGSDEYKATLSQLEVQQAALKNAMHGTATSMEQITAAAKGADESYNGLVRTMAKYKEELRAIDTSTDAGRKAFEDKAKQIKAVNDKLKDLDKLQGNYQRNVGNYKSALEGLSGAFKATAGSAGAVINPLQNMTAGLNALSTTPAIAVMGLLANVISKVVDGMKNSADATDTWSAALAAFKPIGEAVQKVITGIGTAIAHAAQFIVDLLDKWGLLTERMRAYMALETDNQELQQTTRQYLMENALMERQISELRAKAAQKDKYTAQERTKFLQEAAEKERLIEQNKLELAQAQFDIIKRQNDLARENGTLTEKMMEDQNNAFINLVNVETQANEKLRTLNKGIATTNNEILTAEQKAEKEANEAIERELRNLDLHLQDYGELWIKEQERQLQNQKKYEQERLRQTQEGYTRRAQMAEVEIDNEREKEQKVYEIEQEGMEKRRDLLRQFYTDAVARGDLETALAYEQERVDLEYQIELNGYQRRKALRDQQVQDYFTYASIVSGVFGSIAQIYDAAGEEDEKAAKRSKALRTASAVIDTISGAIGAYMQTVKTLPAPWNIPAAAANAAAVLAAGYAQIRQINSTNVGGGASASTQAVVSAPTAFTPNIQRTREVTGASEEERLNRMAADNRVYLVYSDIERANTAARVRVQETEF